MIKKIIFSIFSFLLSVLLPSQLTVCAKWTDRSFDTVLVLDCSESMKSIEDDIKDSALSFCREILAADKNNRIAIVSYSSYAYKECGLTSNYDKIKNVIEQLPAFGEKNMISACELVYSLIESDNDDSESIKIVFMSVGVPSAGSYIKDGEYNDRFPECDVEYANKVYDYVTEKLNPIADVYSIGFFDGEDSDSPEECDIETQLAIRLLKDIADGAAYFPDNADEMFDDIAEDILTQYEENSCSQTELLLITALIICISACIVVVLIFFLLNRTAKQKTSVSSQVIANETKTDKKLNSDHYNGNRNMSDYYYNKENVKSYYVIPSVESNKIYGVSGTYKGFAIEIKDGEIIKIGRHPAFSDLVITEDNNKVSRTHCMISFSAAQDCFFVTDVSMNGTYVKKDRLAYNESVRVHPGTEIQLAHSNNIFRLG